MTRDELLELIDQAAAEGWTELDLAGQKLTELPPEIGQLTQLETLILGKYDEKRGKILGNQFSTLPEKDLRQPIQHAAGGRCQPHQSPIPRPPLKPIQHAAGGRCQPHQSPIPRPPLKPIQHAAGGRCQPHQSPIPRPPLKPIQHAAGGRCQPHQSPIPRPPLKPIQHAAGGRCQPHQSPIPRPPLKPIQHAAEVDYTTAKTRTT
jgi:hypothetical protein